MTGRNALAFLQSQSQSVTQLFREIKLIEIEFAKKNKSLVKSPICHKIFLLMTKKIRQIVEEFCVPDDFAVQF